MCVSEWDDFFYHSLVKDVEDPDEKSAIIQNYFRYNNPGINCKFKGYTCLHYACATNMSKVVVYLVHDYYGKINIDATTPFNETALHLAVQQRNNYMVQILLNAGANPNIHRDIDGQTALHLAIMNKAFDVLESLLNHPTIEVNATDNENFTALDFSVQENEWYMVKLLLEHGANPNCERNDGKSPLHILANGDVNSITTALITNGANLDVLNKNYVTPLHIAVSQGNETMVKLLLDHDARTDIFDAYNSKHIIHYAVKQKNLSIFSMILKQTKNVDVLDYRGFSPLQKAVMKDDEEKIVLLLQRNANTNVKWAKTNKTLLLYSVEKGNITITKLLLQHNASLSINVESKKKVTPLIRAVEDSRVDYVSLLLKHGADANAKNKKGMHALHIACRMNNLHILKLLSKFANFDVNAKDGNDFTALDLAFRMKNYAIVKLLISLGADLNIPNPRTCLTPLHEAITQNAMDIVEELLQNHQDIAQVDYISPRNKTLLHLAASSRKHELLKLLLHTQRCNVNALCNDRTTPLLLAVENSDEKAVELLLEYGADYNIFLQGEIEKKLRLAFDDKDVYSLLHLAVHKDNIKIIQLILNKGLEMPSNVQCKVNPLHIAVTRNEESVKLLLKHGTDSNVRDADNKCALHYPVKPGIAEILIESGADVNAMDFKSRTPLHFAARNKDIDLVTILLKYGACPDIPDDETNSTPLHDAIHPKQSLLPRRFAPRHSIFIELAPDSTAEISTFREDENAREIVRLLLAKTTTAINVNALDLTKRTPLVLAVQYNFLAIARLLLRRHADPTIIVELNNQSLLHIACLKNNDIMLRELLKYGAKAHIDSLDLDDSSPLLSAIYGNSLRSVEVLLQYGANVNLWCECTSALIVALERGKQDIAKCLLEVPGIDVEPDGLLSPLTIAVDRNYMDIVRKLVQLGADPNKKGPHGRTPLHVAATNCNVELLRYLVHLRDVSINEEDSDQRTPLHLVIHGGTYASKSVVNECIYILIAYGADVTRKCDQGFTPVHLAALTGNVFLIDSIIKEQISLIDQRNEAGTTPLHLACRNLQHKIVKKILESGSTSFMEETCNIPMPSDLYLYQLIQNCENLKEEIIDETKAGVAKRVIEKYFARDAVVVQNLLMFNKGHKWFDANYMNSLLFLAVKVRSKDLTVALLALGADMNYRAAIQIEDNPDTTISLAQQDEKILELLIKHENCEINYPGNDFKTVLHYAVKDGRNNIDQVIKLLRKGANPNYRDNQGRTPLLYANYHSKINALLHFGADPFVCDRNGKALRINSKTFRDDHLLARAAFRKAFYNDDRELKLYVSLPTAEVRHFISLCLSNVHMCSLRIDEHLEVKFDEEITYNDILTENYERINMHNYDKITEIVKSEAPSNVIPWFVEYLKIKVRKIKYILPIKHTIGNSGLKLEDFFMATHDQMARYLEMKDVAKFLRCTKMTSYAKWFSYDINRKIKLGNEVFALRNEILKNPLTLIIFRNLPIECAEIILKKLTYHDLIHLNLAITE